MTRETKTALVIGATGGFGHAAATALLAHGWTVRALSRRRPSDPRLQWAQGDLFRPEQVIAAAEGVDVIVQAANPPGYRGWQRQLPAMLDSALAAARASGARLVYPASVYNFDPQATPVVGEATPQRARTVKGRLRIAQEDRLREASETGVRVLLLRAGDFFGPPPVNGWLSGGMVKPGAPLRAVTYPGRRAIGHAWAYLPDLGETLARLLDQETRLGGFEVFHFGGHWLEDGMEMAEAVRRASGRPDLPVRGFPWLVVRAMAPFSATMRGVAEMSYLWREPLRLDNRRLAAFLGEEPHTPLDQAVRTSLLGLGCLGDAAADQPRLRLAAAH